MMTRDLSVTIHIRCWVGLAVMSRGLCGMPLHTQDQTTRHVENTTKAMHDNALHPVSLKVDSLLPLSFLTSTSNVISSALFKLRNGLTRHSLVAISPCSNSKTKSYWALVASDNASPMLNGQRSNAGNHVARRRKLWVEASQGP